MTATMPEAKRQARGRERLPPLPKDFQFGMSVIRKPESKASRPDQD